MESGRGFWTGHACLVCVLMHFGAGMGISVDFDVGLDGGLVVIIMKSDNKSYSYLLRPKK